MQLLLVANDLMVVSRVDGAAKKAGATMSIAGNVPRALELLLEAPVRLIVVDLALPGCDVAALVSGVKSAVETAPPIIAFGPHVHADRLAAAEAAGCDAVMARGQFMAQVDAIVSGAVSRL